MPVSPRPAPARDRRPAPGRIRLGLALLAVLALVVPSREGRAEPGDSPSDPGGPSVTLDAMPLGVPFARLDDDARRRAEAVLGTSLFAQRVTGLRSRSREPVFRFLLDHPDFAAAVARALRLGKYQVEARDGGFWGDDRRGARGTIRVLYQDEGRRLYHLEGTYETRGLPTIQGQLLVMIEFQHEDDPEAGTRVEASVTGHMRLDTPLLGAVAQLATTLARPTVERAVERKVRRFFGTVARVSRWAHDQPEEFWAALEGHPEIPQDATLAAFRQILLAGRPPAWASEPFRLLPADNVAGQVEQVEPTSTSP
jgi:hypothetical protein